MSWDYQPQTRANSNLWEDSRQFKPTTNGTPTANEFSDSYANYDVNDGRNGQEIYPKNDQPEPHVRRDRRESSGYSESGKRMSGTQNPYEEQGQKDDGEPTRPPIICRNCQEPGHEAFGCERPRKISRDHILDMTEKQSWNLIRQACHDHDLDDLKEAVEIYVKAIPEITYQQLEKKFRESSLDIYIIALEKELAPIYTNMDLQGNLDRTFTVTWRWSPKPMRPKEIPFWPKTPAENFERLGNAGEPTDRGVPKCNNCNTFGHIRKNCPEEPVENSERTVVMCINCQQVGHRVRDCTEPREDKFAGRNNRNAENGQDPESNEYGNSNGGGGDYNNNRERGPIVCRNCDAEGHISKECPLPRDYSRVKCQNCQKMGHTKVRCKEPLEQVQNEENGYHDAGNNFTNPEPDTFNGYDGQNNDTSEQTFGKPADEEQVWEAPSNTNNLEW